MGTRVTWGGTVSGVTTQECLGLLPSACCPKKGTRSRGAGPWELLREGAGQEALRRGLCRGHRLAPPPEFQGPGQPHMWQRHCVPRGPPLWLEPHSCDAPKSVTCLLPPRESRGEDSSCDAPQGHPHGSLPRKAGRWPSWPGFVSQELVLDVGQGAGEEKAHHARRCPLAASPARPPPRPAWLTGPPAHKGPGF